MSTKHIDTAADLVRKPFVALGFLGPRSYAGFLTLEFDRILEPHSLDHLTVLVRHHDAVVQADGPAN
jgi:hypothetical protein